MSLLLWVLVSGAVDDGNLKLNRSDSAGLDFSDGVPNNQFGWDDKFA